MKTKSEATVALPAAAPDGVWVLTADEDLLVCFDDWQVVRGLYRFVRELQNASNTARREGDFRVLGASVEVNSPGVQAWRIGGAGFLTAAVDCYLGDGALLLATAAEAAADAIAPEAESELAMVILTIGDDGMLLVGDGDGLEATIDLTNLVAAGRGR